MVEVPMCNDAITARAMPSTNRSLARICSLSLLVVFFSNSALSADLNRPRPVATDVAAAQAMGCSLPSPVINARGHVFYSDNNKSTVSQADRMLDRRMSEPLRTFYGTALRLANSIQVHSHPATDPQSLCLRAMLLKWADAGALLGAANAQGGYHRMWATVPIAISARQVIDDPALRPERRKALLDWLDAVAQRTIARFSERHTHDNLTAWAGAAAVSTASVTGNEGERAWGIQQMRSVLAGVLKDGSLPVESARGESSPRYHCFALTALMTTLLFADRNDLSAKDKAALHRLAVFTLRRSGPDAAALKKHGCLAWMAIYSVLQKTDPSLRVERLEGAFGKAPLHYVFLGDVNLLLARIEGQ